MTLNGVMALILRYFSEFVYDDDVKSSRSLSHLLMTFLFSCRRRRLVFIAGGGDGPNRMSAAASISR